MLVQAAGIHRLLIAGKVQAEEVGFERFSGRTNLFRIDYTPAGVGRARGNSGVEFVTHAVANGKGAGQRGNPVRIAFYIIEIAANS